jgi:hypothetical protein
LFADGLSPLVACALPAGAADLPGVGGTALFAVPW